MTPYWRNVVSAAALIALAGPSTLHSQTATNQRHTRQKPADATELAAIAERGRAIASYDQAAWHATDEVQAVHPKDGVVGMYVGKHTPDGWVIVFGKLNDTKDAFLLAYEVSPSSDPLHPRVKVNTPAVEERGDWLHMARAIDVTRSGFNPQGRPYNDVVLPGPANSWYVYFYPGTTSNDVFPTGADVRYRVSGDGATIEETHTMHASYLEFNRNATANFWFRTAFLDDAPEDTDVANAIMMGGVRGIIAAPTFVYQIAADGTPTYMQPTKEFMKELKKK
jgi:hypothetical protein